MTGAGRLPDDAVAPRHAWIFAATFLCLVLPARLATSAYPAGPGGGAIAAALFVLPLLYTVPRGRVVWDHHKGWLLASQAILTFLPFAILGRSWAALFSGLLGGLLLLTVRATVSWILFAGAVAVELLLRTVLPLPGQTFVSTGWTFIVAVNTAVTLFGLVRLADLVINLRATRTELATLAVSRQRSRSADRLRKAIGDRLDVVAVHSRAALPLVDADPGAARVELAEAAKVARQALDQVRATVTGDDTDHGVTDARLDGETVAPRVARLVLLVVLCAFLAQLLLNMFASHLPVTAKVSAAAVILTVLAAQLYHTLERRNGLRPRGWPWTLAAQVLGVASFWVFDELAILGLAGFAAGSVLLLFPGRWAWAVLAATAAGVGVLVAARSGYGIFDGVYIGASTAATGLVVYALSRLTDVADRVGFARRELARMAVVQERLRVARDTHDLLGLGLSAIALKCDLAMRLIERDNGRSRGEIEQLLDITARALDDLNSVTGDLRQPLSLRNELATARDTLSSAGIEVRADVAVEPFTGTVDEVLATVLREAVTNVLRHANATWCTIRLARTGDVVRLEIANDGADGRGTSHTGGSGIGNLRARTATLGGSLLAGPDGANRFTLVAEIPLAVLHDRPGAAGPIPG